MFLFPTENIPDPEKVAHIDVFAWVDKHHRRGRRRLGVVRAVIGVLSTLRCGIRLGDTQWAGDHGHKGDDECGRRHRL